jgi:hypothetical protein
MQGLPDSSRRNIPNLGKIYQIATKSPNGHTMFQMAVLYSKWPKNTPTFFHNKVLENLPKFGFWFEKKPSGNPVCTSSLFFNILKKKWENQRTNEIDHFFSNFGAASKSGDESKGRFHAHFYTSKLQVL